MNNVFIIIAIAAGAIGLGVGSLTEPSVGLITAAVLLPVLALNFLPTIIASYRGHAQWVVLGVFNFLTSVFPLPLVFIGGFVLAGLIILACWITLLVWSCRGQTREERELEREERLAFLALLKKQASA